jgi:hypothetical protein
MQIRGGDGTGYLQGCLEMRVAYDPGWYLSDLMEFYMWLHLMLGLSA